MPDRIARKLDVRKPLLSVAGWLILAAIALSVFASQSQAQSPTGNKGQSIADTWQGPALWMTTSRRPSFSTIVLMAWSADS